MRDRLRLDDSNMTNRQERGNFVALQTASKRLLNPPLRAHTPSAKPFPLPISIVKTFSKMAPQLSS